MNHLGIDYGSNLAGTTAICFQHHGKLNIYCSLKKQSADLFISSFVANETVDMIFIDAPLSIPLAYKNQGEDFFFRACDRELGAMSPMFLGGLTARAMALKHNLDQITFIETYPKQLVKLVTPELQEIYKSNLDLFVHKLGDLLPLKIGMQIQSWHMLDSVLAWWSGYRFKQGKQQTFGMEKEGLIVI